MIKLYKEYLESKRLANLQTRVAIASELEKLPYMSNRFILTECLITPDQLARTDALWSEEQGTV